MPAGSATGPSPFTSVIAAVTRWLLAAHPATGGALSRALAEAQARQAAMVATALRYPTCAVGTTKPPKAVNAPRGRKPALRRPDRRAGAHAGATSSLSRRVSRA